MLILVYAHKNVEIIVYARINLSIIYIYIQCLFNNDLIQVIYERDYLYKYDFNKASHLILISSGIIITTSIDNTLSLI